MSFISVSSNAGLQGDMIHLLDLNTQQGMEYHQVNL